MIAYGTLHMFVLALTMHVAAPADAAPAPWPRLPSTWGSSNIRDWYAIDDTSIVIRTHGYGSFQGTFMGDCTGIRFTDTLGFSTRGPYELDPSTVIVLPDGRRCAFRELVPIDEAAGAEPGERKGGRGEE
jgi:hypothetical protein